MNQKPTLILLALAHFLFAGLVGVAATTNAPNVLLAVYIGVFFSQTSLLGMWVGLAPSRWHARSLAFLIGVVFLALQFCFSLGSWGPDMFSFVVLSTLAVTGVMLAISRFVVRLGHPAAGAQAVSMEVVRFSTRHLMLLTLFVCIALSLGRLAHPYLGSNRDVAAILSLSACSASVGIASAWAILGGGRLLLRSVAVVGVGLLMASIHSYYWGDMIWWFWSTSLVVESACVLGSLYVVRQCGFRFVRLSG